MIMVQQENIRGWWFVALLAKVGKYTERTISHSPPPFYVSIVSSPTPAPVLFGNLLLIFQNPAQVYPSLVTFPALCQQGN